MKKIDVTHQKWEPYLQESCKHFDNIHRYDLLHLLLVKIEVLRFNFLDLPER